MPTALLRVAIMLLLAARTLAAAPAAEESWHIVEIGGARAGHMHERTETLPDGNIRVSSVMALAIARGPARVEVSVSAESVERDDGSPVSMRVEQRLGAALLITETTFDGRTATIVESQFGQRAEPRTVEMEPGALMPHALATELERRIAAGEERIVLSAIDPMSAGVVESTYMRGEREVIHAAGRAAPVTRWTVEQSAMPGVATTYFLDDEGEVVRGEVALGGISLTMLLTEKELAIAAVEPAELLVSTLVEPDRPIERPRSVRAATYVVRADGGPIAEPSSWGTQTVERIDGSSLRVAVALDAPGAAATDAERADALRSSAMIGSADPEVVALADRAAMELRGALLDDPLEVARACRRFVHAYIDEKSLDVGFATAGEVARTRQGDCTEHAVLLAAILRARAIPARVVTGLVYVDEFAGKKGVFGFHMWTQALLADGAGVERWVDLDATLPGLTDFDAAHIGIAVSAMGGADRVNTMAAVAPLLGAVSIGVERVEHAADADTMRR